MKHYRINKVARPGGPIVRKKDILAKDDREAIQRAREDEDCPVCEILHHGSAVASIT